MIAWCVCVNIYNINGSSCCVTRDHFPAAVESTGGADGTVQPPTGTRP